MAIISGRDSPAVTRRAAELGIRHVRQGIADKVVVIAIDMFIDGIPAPLLDAKLEELGIERAWLDRDLARGPARRLRPGWLGRWLRFGLRGLRWIARLGRQLTVVAVADFRSLSALRVHPTLASRLVSRCS